MQVEIEGTIAKVMPLQSGTSARSGNQWQRQDYLLETPGQYPRKCQFTVTNDNIAQFNLQEGQHVRVSVSIDAHEYNGRWYNDFRCVAVSNIDSAQTQAPASQLSIGEPMPLNNAEGGGANSQPLPWEQQ